MTALTQKQLNQMGCGVPSCKEDHSVLHLNSRCHTGASTEAAYEKATGILTIRCYICKEPVAKIVVASGHDSTQ